MGGGACIDARISAGPGPFEAKDLKINTKTNLKPNSKQVRDPVTGKIWVNATSIADVLQHIADAKAKGTTWRLLHGNTAMGVAKYYVGNIPGSPGTVEIPQVE